MNDGMKYCAVPLTNIGIRGMSCNALIVSFLSALESSTSEDGQRRNHLGAMLSRFKTDRVGDVADRHHQGPEFDLP
jgi:hypothetical protein